MHQAFVFLAWCGFAYGALAIFALGSGYFPARRSRRDARDPRSPLLESRDKAAESSVYSALYWFVTLPVEAPALALCLAGFVTLPALLF
jgi:hypothetical protein